MTPFLSPHLLALSQNRSLRTVWIDAAYAYVHCVLTDNLGGVRELLDHLQQLGHQRFLLVSEDPRSPNPTNENERAAAFQHLARERDLTGEILPGATRARSSSACDGLVAPRPFCSRRTIRRFGSSRRRARRASASPGM